MNKLLYGVVSVLLSVVILSGCNADESKTIEDINKTSGCIAYNNIDAVCVDNMSVSEEITIRISNDNVADVEINRLTYVWHLLDNSGIFECISIAGFFFVTASLYVQKKRVRRFGRVRTDFSAVNVLR